MKFAREPYSDELVSEMMPLWDKHYDEIALYKDIPLRPALKAYEKAAEMQLLCIFTARNAEKLVGYEVLFIHPHMHYSTALQAQQDILFLDPSMRLGLNGYRFIKWIDEQLKVMGVHLVFQHVKKSHNFGKLLERLGYVEHDVLYSRRLN